MGDSDRITVLVTNNEGGGYADRRRFTPGTTVGQVIDTEITREPSNYTIRLNQAEVDRDTVLCDGDRLTITPLKIAGA